jgi:hypothetical protein
LAAALAAPGRAVAAAPARIDFRSVRRALEGVGVGMLSLLWLGHGVFEETT